jgi:hypothetical protein
MHYTAQVPGSAVGQAHAGELPADLWTGRNAEPTLSWLLKNNPGVSLVAPVFQPLLAGFALILR